MARVDYGLFDVDNHYYETPDAFTRYLEPEYQGQGGPALMYAEIFRAVGPVTRIKHAEAIQIAASNTRSLNEGRLFGLDFYKTHHVYRKSL